MLYRTLFLICLTLLAQILCAQYELVQDERFAWSLTRGGVEQSLLTAGGLNNPQVSVADLTGDGNAELYIFDRQGDVHLAFSRRSGGGWTYRPELTAGWPKAISFGLLRDFNADGVPDLYTHADAEGREGVLVYEGFRQNGRTAFNKVEFSDRNDNALRYNDAGDERLIYVAISDIPAVADLDGDGDLDILSFDSAGGVIDEFENVGNTGGAPQSLFRFVRRSDCFGGVYETNLDGLVNLAPAAGECATPFAPPREEELSNRTGFHPGSTITPYDTDGDGDLDLLLGDVNTGFVTELTNSPGANNLTFFDQVDYRWPSQSVAVDIDNFPAVFPVTLPGETQVSFLASPSNPAGGASYEVLWRYPAGADGTSPQLAERDFLTSLAFDHGRGSHFALGDLTGDGVDDLLVGNDSYYNDGNALTAEFALYVYDASTDSYQQQVPSWLSSLNASMGGTLLVLDPTLHDMDADGDLDLLFGSDAGFVSYVENTGGAGAPASFGPLQAVWMGIELGINTSPAVADVTGDGLPDLLVGERRGLLSFFPNVGTATNPSFNATASEDSYGGIDVRIPGVNSNVNTRPAFTEVNGETVLYVGSGQGRMLVYRDLPSSAGGTATLADDLDLPIGFDLDPSFGRDPAGEALIAIGNARGGLSIFRKEGFVEVQQPTRVSTAWRIFPNPSTGEWSVLGLGEGTRLLITDLSGRRVASVNAGEHKPRMAQGVYAVQAIGPQAQPLGTVQRLVIR